MKAEVDFQSGDLHAKYPTGFDPMEEDNGLGMDDQTGIWLENEQEDLLSVTGSSIFYTDFPPLPDFPCMSSSSSSSSHVAVKPAMCSSLSSSSASSSSSAASWAILRSDAEETVDKMNIYDHHDYYHHQLHDNDPMDAPTGALSSTASMEIPQPTDNGSGSFVDCMDVMENLGYMDLLDENNDFFDDPSCIFQNDNINNSLDQEYFPLYHPEHKPEQQEESQLVATIHGGRAIDEEDDMGMVFLEWLKSNRETVSADDLRSVKLKKSTIECAAKRLGGGKDAMKQLLKLVLEWVQTNHLRKRKNNSKETISNPNVPNQFQAQDPFQNPVPNPNPNTINSNSFAPDQSNSCDFTQSSPWISSPLPPPSQPYMTDPVMAAAPMVGCMQAGDPYSNGGGSGSHTVPYPPSQPTEYHMLESAHQSWPPSQFAVASHYNPSFPDSNLPAPPQLPPFTGFGNQYPYPYFPGDQRLMRLGSSATKEARKKRMARQRRYLSHHRQNQGGSGDPHARLGIDNCTTARLVNHGNWVYWPPSVTGGMGSTSPGHPGMDPTAMQTQNYQGRVSSADRRQGWKPEKNLRFLLQKVLKQSDVGNLGRIVLPKMIRGVKVPQQGPKSESKRAGKSQKNQHQANANRATPASDSGGGGAGGGEDPKGGILANPSQVDIEGISIHCDTKAADIKDF
ncbi:B3 domain-containing transcription factor ABI3-like [Quillaja saponaria]|uniref:B3 domain-containing transcription factor ABI3-like n=1 Tax=Quillaja saponaria TaxID=32244 RepID=A0AAD7LNR7_QUISA|nr:B3 domain-containing transcription factor ABI3-like [Quillaja saponaria]